MSMDLQVNGVEDKTDNGVMNKLREIKDGDKRRNGNAKRL